MKTVALVGHCRPDAALLKQAVQRAAPGTKVGVVNDENALQEHIRNHSVILVNRVLDGDFSESNGIDLIQNALKQHEDLVALLISNLTEAQDQAVKIGARQGFGKARVYAPETTSLLRTILTE